MCTQCCKKIRLAIYKYFENGHLKKSLEEIPNLFNCHKELKIIEDEHSIVVMCAGVIHYTVRKDRKMIYGAIPEGSPLKNEKRGQNEYYKRRVA